MLDRKRFFDSSVSSPPANSAESPVSGLNTGLTQFTRMRSGPNSAAIDFDIRMTAAFELLYTARTVRGRMHAVVAMFKKKTTTRLRTRGDVCRVDRVTLLTLT